MFPNKSITSTFTKMTTITNTLDALGRTCTRVDIISKIFMHCQKLGKLR
ncbi:hypothetical protein NC652_013849 [Populus alba x Populus x berolinensis]|nr:hypothetical protein NC652_013849 [Populus alba x Populus x berolinensis]